MRHGERELANPLPTGHTGAMARFYGTCVHCLRAPGTTEDHGVPRAWYPEGSSSAPKVKAPSCGPCNQRLKKIEERLLIPVALSLDPTDARAAGVADGVLRSMDPSSAKNDKDRRHRMGRRNRVRSQVFRPSSTTGALPGSKPRPGSHGAAMPVAHALLEQFGEKLVRVVYWSEYKQLIGRDYTVRAHVVVPGPGEASVAALIRAGERIEVPPGIAVAVRKDPAGTAGLLMVDLWGAHRLFVSVEPVDWHAHGGDAA